MRFIYLIQSDKGEIPYKIPFGQDVLLLQWQLHFIVCENSFHYPNSTWGSGRSELYRRAIEQGPYDYYVFMDDDLSLSFDLKLFETMIKKYQPRRAVPFLVGHTWNLNPRALIDRVKYVDHACMALRADCASSLLPYTSEFDKTCWWLTSERMCEQFWNRWQFGTLRFNNLECRNLLKRPYPRLNYSGLPENKTRARSGRWWLLVYFPKWFFRRLKVELHKLTASILRS